ncbi:sugar transferase [Methylobacterium sp. J-067]|uniref:sugar transferase n=1 Tax=Methylobacterium sp. J-067 TaxID=2836648 RepID=UPI001FB91028|nr:sugar transferase [Methylobacterium sp. J-067]MCJ2023040.1 sugar transferase [Methylobacterium sp. J-067]
MPRAAPITPDAVALAYAPAEATSVSQGRRWLERSAKRAIDVIVAGVALVLLLPLLALVAGAVWAGDRKSPIFRHRRLGRQGRPFGCLKFRTMVVEAEAALAAHLVANPAAQAEWDATHKLTDDPRVTAIGRVLRKTSLDELPQLINVLRGDMSLVGPRPIVQAEVARYGSAFPACFSVPPGVTGLWQVSGRSDTTYEERIALDLAYAAGWSLKRDLVILIRTVPAVFGQRGSR